MVGDLKHGRTVHSLARLLTLYNVRLQYVSPPELDMPNEVVEYVKNKGIPQVLCWISCEYRLMLRFMTGRNNLSNFVYPLPGKYGLLLRSLFSTYHFQTSYRDVMDAMPSTDVLYVTRIQKERFPSPDDYEKVLGLFSVTFWIWWFCNAHWHATAKVAQSNFNFTAAPRTHVICNRVVQCII